MKKSLEKSENNQKEENEEVSYIPQEDSFLKQLAMDIVDNKVFTDRHIKEHDMRLLPSIFMVIALGGAKTTSAIIQRTYKNYYGMIYEYYDKCGPRVINGYPIFFSHRLLDGLDAYKTLQFVQKYEDGKKKMMEDYKKNEIEEIPQDFFGKEISKIEEEKS